MLFGVRFSSENYLQENTRILDPQTKGKAWYIKSDVQQGYRATLFRTFNRPNAPADTCDPGSYDGVHQHVRQVLRPLSTCRGFLQAGTTQ